MASNVTRNPSFLTRPLEVKNTSAQLKLSYDADSFSTITVADNSHTTIATGESGDFTVDAAGDIDINAGGGDIGFKSGGSTLGSFDTNGNFVVKGTIKSDGDATLGEAGNTTGLTLKAVTNTGDRSGKDLTIAAGSAVAAAENNDGGDLILASGGGDGTGTSVMKFLTKVLNVDLAQERMRIHDNGFVGIGVADPDRVLEVNGLLAQLKLSFLTGDSYATIHVADDSHTTIATGESGNLTLDAAGSIFIDSAGGGMRLTNGGSAYTPTHASDITTKAYVDSVMYDHRVCNYNTNSASAIHVPLAGYVLEGALTNANEYRSMVMPYNGTLERIIWRSEIEQTSGTFAFIMKISSDGTELPATTNFQTRVTGFTLAANTTYVHDPGVTQAYDSGTGNETNAFSKGQIIAFSIDPTVAPYDTNCTLVFKYDTTT